MKQKKLQNLLINKYHLIGAVFCCFIILSFNYVRKSKPEANHTTQQVNYFAPYVLNDDLYGTKTEVTIVDGTRKIVTNALPNHKTGNFPNKSNPNTISAQEKTYAIPLKPVYTGKARWAREPGVAINGVKFEPQTAEVIGCETGQEYRVEAKQSLIDLGLDFNNAHVQPTGDYHYHGTPSSLIEMLDQGQDTIHIGFALDGYPIYYSTKNTYKPSYQLAKKTREGEDCTYDRPRHHLEVDIKDEGLDGTFVSDWEYKAGLGDLDECNGIELAGRYIYFVTDDYPFIGRCLKGEFEEPRGGRGGHRPPRRGRKH